MIVANSSPVRRPVPLLPVLAAGGLLAGLAFALGDALGDGSLALTPRPMAGRVAVVVAWAAEGFGVVSVVTWSAWLLWREGASRSRDEPRGIRCQARGIRGSGVVRVNVRRRSLLAASPSGRAAAPGATRRRGASLRTE